MIVKKDYFLTKGFAACLQRLFFFAAAAAARRLERAGALRIAVRFYRAHSASAAAAAAALAAFTS